MRIKELDPPIRLKAADGAWGSIIAIIDDGKAFLVEVDDEFRVISGDAEGTLMRGEVEIKQ